MSSETDVRKASEKLYAALNSMTKGDARAMSDVWSHDKTVTTMHPIGGREIGWEQVRGSFEQVAGLASGGRVELRDQLITLVGPDVAYEIGIEHGEAKLAGETVQIHQRVTNIYHREAGQWKLVHHATDESPVMVDLLKRLQPAGAGTSR